MATVGDAVLSPAFRKADIESPTSTQIAQALVSLNNLISLFGADFMVPSVTREELTLTSAKSEYTIGPSGDLDTVRPINIANGYLEDSDGYSYPIKEMSVSEYNAISLKTQDGRPTKYYFIPEETKAKVIFDYEPDQAYTAHFEFNKNFVEFATETATFSSPNEYKAFFVYNLAISIAEDWGRKVSQTLYTMAERSKEIIERMIATTRKPPKAKFDFTGGGRYNIETDE